MTTMFNIDLAINSRLIHLTNFDLLIRNIMKLLRAILIAVASVATQANAACWKPISETDNSVGYVDACSIAKDRAYKKAWIKREYSTPQSTDDYPAKSYSITMELTYFNCSSRQSASTQGIYYDEDRTLVKTESIDLKRVRFQDSPPGTVGERELDYVCKSKK